MRVLWISALVVFVDQCTKAAVLEFMTRRQSIPLVGDWLKFTFTENPGMAFGMEFGPPGLMAVLSIAVTVFIVWYILQVRGGYAPYVLSWAFILGGAVGNIIDRVFYGVLLDYGPLFRGKVVDFIHVDIGYVAFPEALPVLGGSYIALFPIWNVADMAIVCGVVGILVFQHRFHEEIARRREARRAAQEAETQPAAVDGPAGDSPSYAPAARDEPAAGGGSAA